MSLSEETEWNHVWEKAIWWRTYVLYIICVLTDSIVFRIKLLTFWSTIRKLGVSCQFQFFTIHACTGENLGTNQQDLVDVVILGQDCLMTADWKSSSKIVALCPGSASGEATTGDIIVVTKSGGIGTCNVPFRSAKLTQFYLNFFLGFHKKVTDCNKAKSKDSLIERTFFVFPLFSFYSFKLVVWKRFA